jgi:hypothetical protein
MSMTPSKLKYIMLSGHDNTISAYMSGFNWKQSLPPSYASSILLELYKENEKYYFTLDYEKERFTNNKGQMNGVTCDGNGVCNADELLIWMNKEMLHVDIKAECFKEIKGDSNLIYLWIALGVLGAAALVGGFVMVRK